MAYLPFTFLFAVLAALAVFGETGSYLASFLAYAGTGVLALILALVVAALSEPQGQFDGPDLIAQ